jgi:hypothetical protein
MHNSEITKERTKPTPKELAGRAKYPYKLKYWAETRGFEPPIPFRENLISSEAH